MEKSLKIDEIKSLLEDVSPTFCGAKWNQFLLQLHLGKVHNCCLSPATPLDESGFNSKQLISERERMLKGEKIEGCGVCWSSEANGHVSDRFYKSSAPWNFETYKAPVKAQNVTPTYIELSLSNNCQFGCVYCSPENSSFLYHESQKFGPYRLQEDFGASEYLKRGENFFLEEDSNPHVTRTQEFLSQNLSNLKVLRITGGEPLLHKQVGDLLEKVAEAKNPDLELIFNSNLGVGEKVMERFLSKLKPIPKNAYSTLSFISSIDGWGRGAELARWGFNPVVFERNLLTLVREFPEASFRITATLNNLATPDLLPLLKKILEWKALMKDSDQLLLTTYPLHYPSFLSLGWCRELYEPVLKDCLIFMENHFIGDGEGVGFKTVERDMLIKAFKGGGGTFEKDAVDFSLFISQNSLRRNWPLSDLSSVPTKLLNDGLHTLQNKFSERALSPLDVTKAMRWIDDKKEALAYVRAEFEKGTVGSWALVSVQLNAPPKERIVFATWWCEQKRYEEAEAILQSVDQDSVRLFWSSWLEPRSDLLLQHWVNESPTRNPMICLILMKNVPEFADAFFAWGERHQNEYLSWEWVTAFEKAGVPASARWLRWFYQSKEMTAFYFMVVTWKDHLAELEAFLGTSVREMSRGDLEFFLRVTNCLDKLTGKTKMLVWVLSRPRRDE